MGKLERLQKRFLDIEININRWNGPRAALAAWRRYQARLIDYHAHVLDEEDCLDTEQPPGTRTGGVCVGRAAPRVAGCELRLVRFRRAPPMRMAWDDDYGDLKEVPYDWTPCGRVAGCAPLSRRRLEYCEIRPLGQECKCDGYGWVWGYELDDPSEDTLEDTMTQYTCDWCFGNRGPCPNLCIDARYDENDYDEA